MSMVGLSPVNDAECSVCFESFASQDRIRIQCSKGTHGENGDICNICIRTMLLDKENPKVDIPCVYIGCGGVYNFETLILQLGANQFKKDMWKPYQEKANKDTETILGKYYVRAKDSCMKARKRKERATRRFNTYKSLYGKQFRKLCVLGQMLERSEKIMKLSFKNLAHMQHQIEEDVSEDEDIILDFLNKQPTPVEANLRFNPKQNRNLFRSDDYQMGLIDNPEQYFGHEHGRRGEYNCLVTRVCQKASCNGKLKPILKNVLFRHYQSCQECLSSYKKSTASEVGLHGVSFDGDDVDVHDIVVDDDDDDDDVIFIPSPDDILTSDDKEQKIWLKCNHCEVIVCGQCLVTINQGAGAAEETSTTTAECLLSHVCDKQVLEDCRLANENTKPCPKCKTMIYRTEGCSQMFCTRCHTGFHWNTAQIIKRPENEYFQEYQRQKAARGLSDASNVSPGFHNINSNSLVREFQYVGNDLSSSTDVKAFLSKFMQTMNFHVICAAKSKTLVQGRGALFSDYGIIADSEVMTSWKKVAINFLWNVSEDLYLINPEFSTARRPRDIFNEDGKIMNLKVVCPDIRNSLFILFSKPASIYLKEFHIFFKNNCIESMKPWPSILTRNPDSMARIMDAHLLGIPDAYSTQVWPRIISLIRENCVEINCTIPDRLQSIKEEHSNVNTQLFRFGNPNDTSISRANERIFHLRKKYYMEEMFQNILAVVTSRIVFLILKFNRALFFFDEKTPREVAMNKPVFLNQYMLYINIFIVIDQGFNAIKKINNQLGHINISELRDRYFMGVRF